MNGRARSSILALVGLALAACGNVVQSNGGTTSSTGTGGATSSTGGAGHGGSGAGGAATGGAGTGGAGVGGANLGGAGAGGANAGGAGGCVGTISLVVDNGAPIALGSSCSGAWGADKEKTPLGYEFAGGPVGAAHGVKLLGCVDASPNAQGIELDVLDAGGPGAFTQGTTQYTDALGNDWGVADDPFQVTITTLEPVGGAIDGSFHVTVTHGGNAAHGLDGTFHVCHVPDLLAP
jgi:hypothetical protein